MIPSNRIVDEHQAGPHLINQWSLSPSGFACCAADAVLVSSLTPSQEAALRAANAVVHAARVALETYAAAKSISEGVEPPLTVTVTDMDGVQTTVSNPDHAIWTAAVAEVAATSAATLALWTKRNRI